MDNSIKFFVKQSIETSTFKTIFSDGSIRNAALLQTSAVGVGIYHPGWRWSQHVNELNDGNFERYIGLIISGKMMMSDNNGHEDLVSAGDAFEISSHDHDAWVIGTTPCVIVDFSDFISYMKHS